jgi:hypothetical protein
MEFDDPAQAFLNEAHKKLSEVTTARADLDKDYGKKRADIDAQILKWKRAIDGVMAVAESEHDDPEDGKESNSRMPCACASDSGVTNLSLPQMSATD